jgi:hypothetical protein
MKTMDLQELEKRFQEKIDKEIKIESNKNELMRILLKQIREYEDFIFEKKYQSEGEK